jgi:hypothetical protein
MPLQKYFEKMILNLFFKIEQFIFLMHRKSKSYDLHEGLT